MHKRKYVHVAIIASCMSGAGMPYLSYSHSFAYVRVSATTADVPRSNSTTVTRLSNSGVSAAVTTQAKQPPPSRQLQHQQNRDIQPSEPNFEVLHTFSAEKLQRLLIDEEAYR
jgi:hypothetical protein